MGLMPPDCQVGSESFGLTFEALLINKEGDISSINSISSPIHEERVQRLTPIELPLLVVQLKRLFKKVITVFIKKYLFLK
jgi:hypothetical protein